MITLVAPHPLLEKLRAEIWNSRLESAAILLCTPIKFASGKGARLIVREVHVAPDDAYEERTSVSLCLKPEFGLPLEKKAKLNSWSLVYVHTHPHQAQPIFSTVDDAAEILLARYADQRSPQAPHLALVLGSSGLLARRLGTMEPVRVVEIGSEYRVLSDPLQIDPPDQSAFDRQIRAFGIVGQKRLQSLRIGIVGLGGTGSLVAQQLAYLGVLNYLLADRDNLDTSNLNRTAGATPTDVGIPKVSLAKRMILSIQPTAHVDALDRDIVDQGVVRPFAECDIILCCTDSHASRHLLNQLSYQYMVPVIDLGVSITPQGQNHIQISGHVVALAHGLPCLWCVGNLNPRQVREEMYSPSHRNSDPYFGSGRGEVQPSVISLNGTVASLAITMFLSMVAGIPAAPRHVVYDGNRARVNGVRATAQPECVFCSPTSTALGGDQYPLPERRNE